MVCVCERLQIVVDTSQCSYVHCNTNLHTQLFGFILQGIEKKYDIKILQLTVTPSRLAAVY